MSVPIYTLSESDCSDKNDSDVESLTNFSSRSKKTKARSPKKDSDSDIENFLLDFPLPLSRKTKIQLNVSPSPKNERDDSDIEKYLLKVSSPPTKKPKVKPTTSRSSKNESDSDVEELPLNFPSPLGKKTKVQLNVSPSPNNESDDSDIEKYLLQFSSQSTKKTEVEPNASRSSKTESDSGIENFLLNFPSPSSKKTKVLPNVSPSPKNESDDSDIEDYLLKCSPPPTKKTKVKPSASRSLKNGSDSDVEELPLNFPSPLGKKTKVQLNVSPSPKNESDDSDLEKYLHQFSSSPTKKTKGKPNASRSPKKKSRLPTKTQGSRKTDEEKQRLQQEKQEAKENRLRLKEEKQKAAEEKIRQKNEKKKQYELFRQLKPEECLKFISVFIDSNLLNCKFGGEILTALTKGEIKYTVREQLVPNTISWQRTGEYDDTHIPNHIVVIWTWEELVNLLSLKNLDTTVDKIVQRYPGHKVTLVIFGIEDYFRQRKVLENRALKSGVLGEQPNPKKKSNLAPEVLSNLSRTDIEMALTSLQLRNNQQYHFFEKIDEIGLFVYQFTKAMAELPYKLQRRKKEDALPWFADADSCESVSVDKDGHGLLRLWQEQLCQFPNIGLDTAQAIAAQYPSPTLLMEAYEKCTTRKEGEMLLQNIQVRRGHGPLPSTARRVGPQFSKKAYKFFTSTNGSEMLSMED